MGHTTEELLFAAQVRGLASQLREQAFKEAQNEWRASHPAISAPERHIAPEIYKAQVAAAKADSASRAVHEHAFSATWNLEHPIAGFIKPALDSITAVADQIKTLRS